LRLGNKYCTCGETGGRYLDDLYCAIFFGHRVESAALGISNSTFRGALRYEFLPNAEWGEEFKAWRMPPDYWRFKKIKKKDFKKNWVKNEEKQKIEVSRKKRNRWEDID